MAGDCALATEPPNNTSSRTVYPACRMDVSICKYLAILSKGTGRSAINLTERLPVSIHTTRRFHNSPVKDTNRSTLTFGSGTAVATAAPLPEVAPNRDRQYV